MRLVLFLFFPFILYSQESRLSGTFCNPVPMMDIGQCFTFSNDQTFTWNKGNHVPPDISGGGHFKIIEDKLILNYQNMKAYDFSYYKQSKRVSLDEKIKISFIVKDFNEESLSSVQVAILDNHGYLIDRIILDENGEGNFIFDCSNELIKFEISRVGFEGLIFETNKNNNYIIDAFLSNLNQKLTVEPHQDTLLIKKQTVKQLVLENSKGNIIEFSKIN